MNQYNEADLRYDGQGRARLISSGQLVNGVVICEYISSKKIKSETPYKYGVKNGTAKAYYESGELLSETPYKYGKIEGIDKWYSKSGELQSKNYFESGKFQRLEICDESGGSARGDSMERDAQKGKLEARIEELEREVRDLKASTATVSGGNDESINSVNNEPYYKNNTTTDDKKRHWLEIYFSFNGRISRKAYWLYCFLPVPIFAIIISFIIAFIFGAVGIKYSEHAAELVVNVLFGLFLWMILATMSKRLHDSNSSMGCALTYVIIGLFAFHGRDRWSELSNDVYLVSGLFNLILFILLCRPSTKGPNEYGEKPFV